MTERGGRGRWRGDRAGRFEALTDAFFGFSITLLVVSLQVPDTFDDLLVSLRGFLAFACSFALLILAWWHHYRLFGRHPPDDGCAVFLNSVLLFVVLFHVYPLKFVFAAWLCPVDGPPDTGAIDGVPAPAGPTLVGAAPATGRRRASRSGRAAPAAQDRVSDPGAASEARFWYPKGRAGPPGRRSVRPVVGSFEPAV